MVEPSAARWTIESFNNRVHDRTGFDCGVAALNEWLATKASQFERKDLARTYVLLEEGRIAVRGYYTLSNHTVVYEAFPEEQLKGLPRIDIPVALIGRLAVDRSYQGQGLGEFLLIDALRRCVHLATKIGIRAVEVHALDGEAKRFYEKRGFLPFLDDPQHLFLPLHIIRKLDLPPS